MSSGIADVLGSFSLSQLRDLAVAMGSRGVEPPRHNLGKSELLAFLKNRKSDAALALFAHRIEAITPYKHLFLYSLDGSKFSLPKAKTKIQAAYPNFIGGVRKVDPQAGGELEPEACLADEDRNRIYVKLVHEVEMSGWVQVSRTERRLKEFRKRHPVVITLRPAEGLLTIGFPGFTYLPGMQQHENRVVYSDIASQGVGFLKDKLKIESNPFNAKPAIDAMLEEEPGEVMDVKRSVRPKKGGRFAFDAGEENELTIALTEFLTHEGDIPVNTKQIRDLLRRSGASDIVLVWKRLQILTRLALLQEAPEFLFIWRDSGPSSTAVDAVLHKMTSYERLVTKPGVSAIRKEMLASPLDQVVRPAMVAQQYGLPRADVVEILNAAVARGNFEPRFRVNTDSLLVDFANTWRRNLGEFPHSVRDEEGNLIDLTLPSNIEVAFQRVK